MEKNPRFADAALLLLRLSGLYLACGHGLGKVIALASGRHGFVESVAALGLPAPLFFAWAAALSELVGGLCVAFGLGTRIAAVFAAATMFVAGFARHRALSQLLVTLGLMDVSDETVSSWGNPEKAILFLIVFVAIALLGPGRFSVDRLWRRRAGSR